MRRPIHQVEIEIILKRGGVQHLKRRPRDLTRRSARGGDVRAQRAVAADGREREGRVGERGGALRLEPKEVTARCAMRVSTRVGGVGGEVPGGLHGGKTRGGGGGVAEKSRARRSVEYAAEVSCENYVVPGVWENCQVSEDRDGAMWGERRRRRGRRARNEWCVDWTSRRRTFGRVGGRTSRSDDGCAALAGGSPPSSRLNPCSPADAREGTNRSEYTVSRPLLEVDSSSLAWKTRWNALRAGSRRSGWRRPATARFPRRAPRIISPSRRNRLAPRGARVASANKRESSGGCACDEPPSRFRGHVERPRA